MRPREPLARAALLLVAAVAVCDLLLLQLGGDGQVKAASSRQVVADLAAPTQTPSLPAAARDQTEAGATAFALYWFDALNWSLSQGDEELLVHSTGAGCRQCTGWLLGMARWKAAGSRLTGGLTYPLTLSIGPFRRGEPVSFAATFATSPALLTLVDGRRAGYPGGTTRGGLTVLWSHGQWQMTDVVLDASQPQPMP